MVKAGMLPASTGNYKDDQTTTLAANNSGRFEDRWVDLKVNPDSPCIFTRDIDKLYLPIRHGEGLFYASPETINELKENNQDVLRYADVDGNQAEGVYPLNPNGSVDDIAGICDPTGRVLGLMPHPEAFQEVHNHPKWTRDRSAAEEGRDIAMQIFKNSVEYAQG